MKLAAVVRPQAPCLPHGDDRGVDHAAAHRPHEVSKEQESGSQRHGHHSPRRYNDLWFTRGLFNRSRRTPRRLLPCDLGVVGCGG